MPVACTFVLNRSSVSNLVCPGFGSVPAYSGRGKHIDDPGATALKKAGPLPAGTYFIVDRQSGGRLGWFNDLMADARAGTDRSRWFALYRNDGTIDDWTFVEGVRRGNFRLHPSGWWGMSEGCITLPHAGQFDKLRQFLKAQPTRKIPGTTINYYGTVTVR
ncbi:DUF2778 domain-containing protein [Paraburkholderia sp. NMBU_R16]|uniref:DUF2778 domain-containing protein n=1 Tax=Paraburkholderia sp. NMBU_R16 TaxID=2698676 RepID=UPI0015665A01|nr:DUF2778 domain-containing protein [Paraburkholderia sp. NMBU_R16]NRO95471.1 DUF2778 domain-containing protein [Paraburkholderia sp. NMBU_R16]